VYHKTLTITYSFSILIKCGFVMISTTASDTDSQNVQPYNLPVGEKATAQQYWKPEPSHSVASRVMNDDG